MHVRTILLAAILALTAMPSALAFDPGASPADVPLVQPAPSYGPGLDVCIDGQTDDGCYGDAWICVTYSYQVPQCVDHVAITCKAPCIPVGACAKLNGCGNGADVCVYGFSWVPFCQDVPCTDGACFAAEPIAQPPVGACVRLDACSGDNDACVYAFSWVPQCVDAPCTEGECITVLAPELPPLPNAVCAKEDGCYGGHDVCVYAFHWVPQCADLPVLA